MKLRYVGSGETEIEGIAKLNRFGQSFEVPDADVPSTVFAEGGVAALCEPCFEELDISEDDLAKWGGIGAFAPAEFAEKKKAAVLKWLALIATPQDEHPCGCGKGV